MTLRIERVFEIQCESGYEEAAIKELERCLGIAVNLSTNVLSFEYPGTVIKLAESSLTSYEGQKSE